MKWNNKGQANDVDVLSIGETIIMPGCFVCQDYFGYRWGFNSWKRYLLRT